MTLLCISYSFFSIYFVCTCFFEDKYLRDVVHLETYTHERWYLPIWYPFLYIVCRGHAKHWHSMKTMLMINAHICTSLIICFVMSLTHHLVELILMFFLYICSTICSLQFMPLVIICSFAHICVLNKIEEVRIPCCAHCI